MAPLHMTLGLSFRVRVFRSVFHVAGHFQSLHAHCASLGPRSVRRLKCCQMPSQGRPELISSLKYK